MELELFDFIHENLEEFRQIKDFTLSNNFGKLEF